jgi:hypothetical protein
MGVRVIELAMRPSNCALDQTVRPVTPVARRQGARRSVPPVRASVRCLLYPLVLLKLDQV